MKIKKLPLLICVALLLELLSLGVFAAAQEHDISTGDVILTDTCGADCPGHVITGNSGGNNLRILSGDHKVTLKDLNVHCSYPAGMNESRIPDGSALYIAEGVGSVELTVEGSVYFHNVYGLYSAAEKLTILGNETSELFLSGKYEAAHVKNDLVIKGGYSYFGTASFPGPDGNGYYYRRHLRGLVAEGTVTFEEADIEATTSAFPETDDMDQVYPGGADGDVASAGIEANELIVKNSVINASCGSVAYKEGTFPYSIAINAETMDVSDSEIRATGGDSYNSFGISCAKSADFVNSDVTAYGGTAENESNGFDAYFAIVGALNSAFDLNGGTSDCISVGGSFSMLDIVDSTVDGYGREAKLFSAGLYGGALSAENSRVNGYGDIATDTNVAEDEDGKTAAFSGGLSFGAINGIDSVIYGQGEKAMISNGIRATEITVKGGLIEGIGDDEGEESFGIYMEASQMDDGTPIPVKFELVGGDVVARGGTQGVLANTEDFAGVFYKADENAEAQVKTDLDSKEFLFGNKYKVTYISVGVKAEGLPADGAYHRDEVFLLPKEGPVAEGYQFVGWMDEYGYLLKAEDDNYVSMGGEDTVYTAVWKCRGGKDCILNKYDDLNAKAWYHDGIEYCIERKMMQGMSKTTFEPDTTVTRAMIVTTLYRLEGEPEVRTQNEFFDVPADAWYTDAVNWAVECGIANGYENNSFRPNQPATREELATFLYRMAEFYGLDMTAEKLPDQFADKDDVSQWAVPALEWAVDQGIINGLGKDTLVPQGNPTRAQLATMLARFEQSLIEEA